MSCHRPTARHCSCAPEPVGGDALVASIRDTRRDAPRDPRAPEPLAALPLRDELADQLERELARQRPGTTTALLFCDVVGGGVTAPGAALLAAAAARVRGALRRSDPLAHCGGGRFLAVLRDLPLEGADEVAARAAAAVRGRLDEPVATGAGLVPLCPVVGVLVSPGGACAVDLLAAAERALDAGTDSLR